MVTPAETGFPRTARLLSPPDFSRVYDHRLTAAAGPLVLYALPNGFEDGRVRLGLSVSRRIGNAVVRNRWKRRLREAFRRQRASLPPGNDFVIVVRSGSPPAGAAGARTVEESIAELAARVTGRRGYAAAAARPASPPPRRRR